MLLCSSDFVSFSHRGIYYKHTRSMRKNVWKNHLAQHPVSAAGNGCQGKNIKLGRMVLNDQVYLNTLAYSNLWLKDLLC